MIGVIDSNVIKVAMLISGSTMIAIDKTMIFTDLHKFIDVFLAILFIYSIAFS